MAKKKVCLVANAHLDPVWLWQWEEGAAEALSTFRAAASLCKEFKNFVFNHNEVILYKWVEEYEPSLFKRIQKLVREKRWHIMGGWYLQPDCNMPSGESFVRQILLGKSYFKEKFGVDVRTGSNLDSFGHSRGLVQILAKSGCDSYLFCRPGQPDCPLPADEFVWVGFDGSEIMASRASAHYNSRYGGARNKVEEWIKNNPDKEVSIVLWGVGNHGGGPSKLDLEELAVLMKEVEDVTIIHSTPEAYFKELKTKKSSLPRHNKDLNPWAVGCYTSMAGVKQKHRQLENELFLTEKMASAAFFQGLMKYPKAELREAFTDLAFGEFHDILPGSSIPAAEEDALRLMNHGLETLSRAKARAFFALASGQRGAREGEIPIFVYNPHPFKVRGPVECEFQPPEINWSGGFLLPRIFRQEKSLPAQWEKEASNLNVEWRKKVVFEATLEPSQMNRFVCWLERVPSRPTPALKETDGAINFKTDDLEVIINAKTGLIGRYRVKGIEFLEKNAFQPLVIADSADSWGMTVKNFRQVESKFELMPQDAGSRISGITAAEASSVRIVEDGEVRTIIESVLSYRNSIIFLRYKLPKAGTEIEVEARVHWLEKDKMLKLSIPTFFKNSRYLGQAAYGVQELPSNGDEAVAQKWVAVVSKDTDLALTCINDGVYGSDYSNGELRVSLLRSPAYSCDPAADPIVAQDRYVPRHDQGERCFRFWINGGPAAERLDLIDREAIVKNEKPYALSFFPSGRGKQAEPFVVLSDHAVQVAALKKAEEGEDLIIRLFEPTGKRRTILLSLPFIPVEKRIVMLPFEIKTLRFNLTNQKFCAADLLENPVRKKP